MLGPYVCLGLSATWISVTLGTTVLRAQFLVVFSVVIASLPGRGERFWHRFGRNLAGGKGRFSVLLERKRYRTGA